MSAFHKIALLLRIFATVCEAQSGLSTGQTIGVSVGVVMAVLLIAVIVYLFCRRWKTHDGKRSRPLRGYENPDVAEETLTTSSVEKHEETEEESSAVEVVEKRVSEPVDSPLVEPVTEKAEASTQTKFTETKDKQTGTKELAEKSSVSVQTEEIETLDRTENPAPPDGDDEQAVVTEEEVSPPKLKRQKSRQHITFTSGWRREVKLTELIRANLILETRVEQLEREEVSEAEVEKELKPFLIGHYPIAGVIIEESGKKMSLFEAFNEGIITRGTAVSLLEAQAAVGSIINPKDGERMSVDKAKVIGLIDKKFAGILIRAERAVTGFNARATNEILSLFQAMKRKLVVESHGIRLLEAQIATGGIIDPQANVRLPVEVAFERGLFDEHLHKILEDPSDDTKGFLDPNTGDNLTYLELLQRCVEDEETGHLLLPLIPEEQRREYADKYANKSYLSSPTHSNRTFSLGSDNTSMEED